MQQDRRKQKETKDRLGSIQDRISRALSRYDLGNISVEVLVKFPVFFSRENYVSPKINLSSKLKGEFYKEVV